MVFECAKKVEEDLARDLERLDEVALLEDCVRHARQRLLVRQLGDSEHVDAPLFRILQDLRRITIIYTNNNGIENVHLGKLSFVFGGVRFNPVLRQGRTTEAADVRL